jgi:hypothetical protein
VTPNELAAELGVPGIRVRNWLRRNRPRGEDDKWTRWELTSADEEAIRDAFAARALAVSAAGSLERDWFWEGNVQAAIARDLEKKGWFIEFLADTARRGRGDDIRARKGRQVLRVEVKGWPTTGYADPRRANEVKRTQPSTQAGHWYSQALLRAVRDLGRHPGDLAAIGLPDWPRFRRLFADTEEPLERLGIGVFFVSEDGRVSEALRPH